MVADRRRRWSSIGSEAPGIAGVAQPRIAERRRRGSRGGAAEDRGAEAPGIAGWARPGIAGGRGLAGHLIRLRNSCQAVALNSRTGPRPFALVSRPPTAGPAPSRAEASSTQLLP